MMAIFSLCIIFEAFLVCVAKLKRVQKHIAGINPETDEDIDIAVISGVVAATS